MPGSLWLPYLEFFALAATAQTATGYVVVGHVTTVSASVGPTTHAVSVFGLRGRATFATTLKVTMTIPSLLEAW